jgi:hypothetical protein
LIKGVTPKHYNGFKKVNESQLSATDRDKFNFQKDMHFLVQKIKLQLYLNKVVNSKEYGSQAKYYLGFV